MIKVTDENGNEIEAYTADELAAQKAESEVAIAAAKKELETSKAEQERLNRHISEQKDNFKKLNEMTEAEKAKFSAEQLETMKRVEASEARAKALEDKINKDENDRMASDKEKFLSKYHGGNKELKEALEKNYDLINLVGSSSAIIEERARLAANMEKGKIGTGNPLFANLNGESPHIQKKSENDKFMESEKAKKALELMGDKPEAKK